jgi:hypothetical protein
MEWSDVHDPSGEFVIDASWAMVKRDYVPEEIQGLVELSGVEAMVTKVNHHFRQASGSNALVLAWVAGRKAVQDAPAST